ncbi:MAG: glutamate-5-semialdehyde dehydrogenase [Anaerolineae bacterium]|nr:glutamate-5-semialdehyde dehydrogenase [Anaerolineae bacterium]
MSVDLQALGRRAKIAAPKLARLNTQQRNEALLAIADALEAHTDEILAANAKDVEAARAKGLTDALVDRLNLQGRLTGIVADVRKIVALPDPVGCEYDQRVLENGLRIARRTTPIGVIGVIYEARPNVTVDVVTLCIKSGNAVLLRGGSETIESNTALVRVMKAALAQTAVPTDGIQLIESTDRDLILAMLHMYEYIDMIIPRGGAALHKLCRENSMIPVITGGIGVCHIYVDETADQERALEIIYNAKTSRPSVCNSLDTVLVNEKIAAEFLPRVVDFLSAGGVTFRAEPRALAALNGITQKGVQAARPEDFDTEWMSLVLGLKVVDTLDEAIEHINTHSQNHSDSILTHNMADAERFLNEVDSSAVFVNASTRFNDGAQFGLGAEIAVSTQKLHARGPMGLEELTTYKWVVIGDGQIRV